MEIKKVCVVGAGTMGNGIAQVSAQAGYETMMVDINQELCDRGMNAIKISLDRFVKRGAINQEEMDKILSRIHTSTNLKDAGKDAGDSPKNVSAAHHQARDDSGVREGKDVQLLRPKDIDEGYSATPDGARKRFF